MFEVFSPECKSGVSNGEGLAWFDHGELKRERSRQDRELAHHIAQCHEWQ